MKTMKFIVAAAIAAVIGVSTYAQMNGRSEMDATKTENLKVFGNCESCKTRIEKAAKVEGVSKAEWNVETKMLTLVYDPTKINSDDIQKNITAAGHDTEKFKADDKAYSKLPGCCQYKR